MQAIELLAIRGDVGGECLRVVAAQRIRHEVCNLTKIVRRYAPANEFRRADTKAIHIAIDARSWKAYPTREEPSTTQMLGSSLPAAMLGRLQRELVRRRKSIRRFEDRQIAIGQCLCKRFRQIDHGCGIVHAVVPPIQKGECQRRRLCDIEIRRHAWKGDLVQPFRDLRLIRDNQPTRRTAKALIGAHGHDMRTLGQRVRPGTAGDDTALMGCVKQYFRTDLVGNGPDFLHRMGRQVQAATDGDQAGSDFLRQ